MTNSQLLNLTEEYIHFINGLLYKEVTTKYSDLERQKKSFLEYVQKELKLHNKNDWNIYIACKDLIEDTNLAMGNFDSFEMEGPTRYNDLGEKYLRLYGFLNAAYLQQNAVKRLCQIFAITNSYIAQVDKLEIRKVRSKLAAHADHHSDNKYNKKDAYMLTRISLNKDKLECGTASDNNYERIDLSVLLEEHLKLMLDILDDLLDKLIHSLCMKNAAFSKQYKRDLEMIREKKVGNIVIKLSRQGKEMNVIIVRVSRTENKQ